LIVLRRREGKIRPGGNRIPKFVHVLHGITGVGKRREESGCRVTLLESRKSLPI
jgi:hypothetical protein